MQAAALQERSAQRLSDRKEILMNILSSLLTFILNRPTLSGTGDVVVIKGASKANITIAANSNTTATIQTPSTPTGYTLLGLISTTIDSTGTTSAANTSYVIVPNNWGSTTATTSFTLRNLANSQAKVTLNGYWLYARTAS